MSVHRIISTAVMQRFVAVGARTALTESIESEDVSDAAASIPDVTATNHEGCVAACDFSGRPIRNPVSTGTMGDCERCASGHAGVMEPRMDAGPGILSPRGAGMGKSMNEITVMGYPRISLMA